jgi:hypothetical protein
LCTCEHRTIRKTNSKLTKLALEPFR